MFSIIKEKVDIVEAISKQLDIAFKKIGDNTYGPEDNQCPFCGHKDCFRVKNDGEQAAFYHCFSCGEHGDVISFFVKAKNCNAREAALLLAKEYKVQLPNDYSPIQDMFNLASVYYHNCYLDTCNIPYPELNKLTPREYQEQIRKHNPDSMEHFSIGWSDGKLVLYLQALGFELDLIAQSGLMNKKGGDFLPSKAFIYPHLVRGRVSHFTFKDPLKKVEYQLKNSSKLNDHSFYNSDTVKDNDTVIVVEGENDLISVHEAGWGKGLIASIGQLSAAQLVWMEGNLENKNVITIFDTDIAGDKYREKVGKLKSKFLSLVQVKLSAGIKDVDEYLVNGGKLEAAIASSTITELNDIQEAIVIKEEESSSGIIEKNGAYYKAVFKDGEMKTIKLSNFTMKLRNIFVKGMEREREIIVTREDGTTSGAIPVNSDCKVSVKPFKTFVANAVDGSFYGQESDLIGIWEHVFSKGTEKLVYIPMMVGRTEEFNGWMFRDAFITDTGAVIEADKEGIFWMPGKKEGVKSASLEVETSGSTKLSNLNIPTLRRGYSREKTKKLMQLFVDNLASNFGSMGLALTMLGWMKANVYSDWMFDKVQGFPYMLIWSKFGSGKTVISKWLVSLLGMDDFCYGTIPQLRSGVGFSRKLSYYSSLPVIVDEVRNDALTVSMYGVFRSWYQRAGRVLGTKEGFGVKIQQVRSNVIFTGEDLFHDDATRQRCIPIHVPNIGRETVKSFEILQRHRPEFSAIGMEWIIDLSTADMSEIYRVFDNIDSMLVDNGCESRMAKNWACVAVFAKQIADEFCPGFNFYEYLLKASKEDLKDQEESSILSKFFSVVEGMQTAENSKLNGEHIKKDEGKLYIWFKEVFRLVKNETRTDVKEEFSESALRATLRDEPYFIEDTKFKMGMTEARRRVLVIDLARAPDVFKNIGNHCG